ncbi:MAG: transcriptional regulator Anr [Gammaproteobacteria bacterium]|nr:MAG: transcriptional regulator Anr [Gammaproteobacteria bacterium]
MTMGKIAAIVNINEMKVACEDCSLRELCLPLGLNDEDIGHLGKLVKRKHTVKKGEFLYRIGDTFSGLFAINAGSIKTSELARNGHVQITGFHLPGELLGMDAISSERHPCDAVALEATEVCEIPLDTLEELARKVPGLQRQLLRIMSSEILKEETLLMMLGKMSAEGRMAACLMSFYERFDRLGISSRKFRLTMSRQDIGDYLGLALETVSRLFSRFQDEGLIKVEGRHVELLDLDELWRLAGGQVMPRHKV